MALRVTPDEVKEIIDTDLTDPRITAFITGANAVVEDRLVGKGLSTSLLKEIERWLAAHYIAANIERQAIQEKAGPASQSFANIFGKHLLSTTYGQTAAELDSTGTLASAGKKAIVFKAISECE